MRSVIVPLAFVGALVAVLGTGPRADARDEGAAGPLRAALFGFTFIDTSTEGAVFGARDDEAVRLERLNAELAEKLVASGRYELVDIAPVADKVADRVNMAQCNGCDSALARELGADVAVTGEVQKVSNLILNINVYIRDAETGAFVAAAGADIRGNNDRSWSRGLDWLMRNRILKQN